MASPRRSWSLSLLPPEIIHEIFYKTPAEALVRSKPTCKKLYTLITDETFIHKHFQRSQEHFLRATDTVQIMDPSTRKNSVLPVPSELLRHPFKIDSLVNTHMVHCDGFMLVEYKMWKYRDDGSRDTNLALWNPVLRNIRWIEPSRSITSSDYHGIGYKDKASDGYKILRFTSCPLEIERYEDEPEVEIYECKTSSWRTLDIELDMDMHIMRNCVAVMGNMYWVAYTEDEEEFIRCFDFSDETFTVICVCPSSYDNSHLASFNGDSLSLLQQDLVSRTIEVWVSSRLGDVDCFVSFSKYFSLSGPDIPALPFHDEAARPFYWVGVEGEDDKVCLPMCQIDDDGVRNYTVIESDYSRSNLCGYVYVPSMIPLPWVRD
ncbi:unnamed protein product [Eruca vesicaria subsp. sativa]|uniref:F-box domain-containing protein n=1 Tax=Eruca vesicaria subsp. sativa TaxID=29727 RepID=A0ABC8IMY5_ERUVS|nr:unnamed protein product [Eruca vesicaria subsp. sativa]